MKRIIPFCVYMILVIPAGLLANTLNLSPKEIPDTSSNTASNSKSLILHGNLSAFNAAYGKNYFELNWSTVAGDFDHFIIERSLDGERYETMGTVKSNAAVKEGHFNFR